MSLTNLPKADAYEQSGAGLRDLLHRFKVAHTVEELLWIATEAERRANQPGLTAPIETAYGILADLARARAAALPRNETADA
jgi:hypothetical protein